MEKLIEKLSYFYEIDINNCLMTNKDWIIELAKAMQHNSYKKDFIKEYKEYKKLR
jgi:hypothetical protein